MFVKVYCFVKELGDRMGGVHFRGGWVVDKKTTTLSNINAALIITLVILLVLGMPFVFAWPPLVTVYVVLVSALTVSARLYRKKSRFEVVDEGIVLGEDAGWSGAMSRM